jgi:hypothetical protein
LVEQNTKNKATRLIKQSQNFFIVFHYSNPVGFFILALRVYFPVGVYPMTRRAAAANDKNKTPVGELNSEQNQEWQRIQFLNNYILCNSITNKADNSKLVTSNESIPFPKYV